MDQKSMLDLLTEKTLSRLLLLGGPDNLQRIYDLLLESERFEIAARLEKAGYSQAAELLTL